MWKPNPILMFPWMTIMADPKTLHNMHFSPSFLLI